MSLIDNSHLNQNKKQNVHFSDSNPNTSPTNDNIFVFNSDKEDLINKWVVVLNYFIRKNE